MPLISVLGFSIFFFFDLSCLIGIRMNFAKSTLTVNTSAVTFQEIAINLKTVKKFFKGEPPKALAERNALVTLD